MKCCENEKESNGGCGGSCGCAGKSVTLVADCSKGSGSPESDLRQKKEDWNDINELEIHYTVVQEEQSEFVIFEKLCGVTNLQHREIYPTKLEDGIYTSLEELVSDINDFLKCEKNLQSRLSQSLEVYFIA